MIVEVFKYSPFMGVPCDTTRTEVDDPDHAREVVAGLDPQAFCFARIVEYRGGIAHYLNPETEKFLKGDEWCGPYRTGGLTYLDSPVWQHAQAVRAEVLDAARALYSPLTGTTTAALEACRQCGVEDGFRVLFPRDIDTLAVANPAYFLSSTQVAGALDVTPRRAQQLIREHKNAQRHGGEWLLPAAALADLRSRPRVGWPKGKARKK